MSPADYIRAAENKFLGEETVDIVRPQDIHLEENATGCWVLALLWIDREEAQNWTES